MSTERYDVIVVGLGAMGSATAYHMARGGARVLGLDRYTPPHAWGSSHGETRILRTAYWEHPAYVPMVRRALELWRALETESGQRLFLPTGALMMGRAEDAVVRGTLQSAAAHTISCEQLDAKEIHRRFPALHPEPGTVGVFETGAGILLPEACVEAHLECARRAGAEMRFGETVLRWREKRYGVEVETEHGVYGAATLVLTAGPWLPDLLPGFPLEVERQAVFWFQPKADTSEFTPYRFPVYLWEVSPGRHFYGFPDVGSGVKSALTHWGRRGSVAALDRSVTDEDLQPVRAFLDRHIPDASGPVVRASVCTYTNTPDGHFLVDQQPDVPWVWLVSPCSGHGFKFASVIGQEVACSVRAGRVTDALMSFRLSRFLSDGPAGSAVRLGPTSPDPSFAGG